MAFDTKWVAGFLYMLTVLSFPSYFYKQSLLIFMARCSKHPLKQIHLLARTCGLGQHREGRHASWVFSPSQKKLCCISSSSFQWRTTHPPSVGLLLAHMSEGCRCFNQSVFALLPVHLGTLVTGNSLRLCSFILRQPHKSPNQDFRLKVSWSGEPLVSATRQIRWQRVDPRRLSRKLRDTEVGSRVHTAHRPVAKATQWILHNAIHVGAFRLPWQVSCDFSSFIRAMQGHNAKMGHAPSQSVCPASRDFILWVCHTGIKTQAAIQPMCDPPHPPTKKLNMSFLYTSFQNAQVKVFN
jgi:hypothetical protein